MAIPCILWKWVVADDLNPTYLLSSHRRKAVCSFVCLGLFARLILSLALSSRDETTFLWMVTPRLTHLMSVLCSEGSNLTPAHHYADFRFKTYAPVAFRYFRELFGIRPDDYLVWMDFCSCVYPALFEVVWRNTVNVPLNWGCQLILPKRVKESRNPSKEWEQAVVLGLLFSFGG